MINRDVSSALNFLGDKKKTDNYKTTTLFIKIVSKWFTLITSRSPSVALGKKIGDEKSENKFNETVKFLESVRDLFRDIEIGKKKDFKSVQTGIMLTTQSFIDLTKYLISKRKYLYVLGGRFTQECVENLFSNIRKKFPVPNALQFKHSLKILSVSQYFQELNNTNYEQDDGNLIADFLKRFNKDKSKVVEQIPVIPLEAENKVINMNNFEMNSLYNVCGYVISRICKLNRVCNDCINSAGSKTYLNSNIKYSKFVQLKCYRTNTLFFVNNETFNYFFEMEIIFRKYIPYLKNTLNCDLVKFFTQKMAHIRCDTLNNCHDLFNKIMIYFIRFRIRTSSKNEMLKKPIFNSKTMAMHSIIK